jgi:hypothetical protein
MKILKTWFKGFKKTSNSKIKKYVIKKTSIEDDNVNKPILQGQLKTSKKTN